MYLFQRIENLTLPTKDKPDSEWLTVRELAKKLKVKQDDIINAIDDSEHLDLIVGGAVNGGYYTHDSKGDYQVEYYQ